MRLLATTKGKTANIPKKGIPKLDNALRANCRSLAYTGDNVSQMVTYLFVIEELGVVSTSRAYKAKIRRVTKDVVKSEV